MSTNYFLHLTLQVSSCSRQQVITAISCVCSNKKSLFTQLVMLLDIWKAQRFSPEDFPQVGKFAPVYCVHGHY